MPLKDFLMPGEIVRFSSPQPVRYLGENYEFFITDRRLLWYKRKGLIFRKDKVISESVGDIIDMTYEEKGIISKKGLIKITTGRKNLEFGGALKTIKAIYSELQSQGSEER